jgi:hypothetical protein
MILPIIICLAALLVACGGGEEKARHDTTPNTELLFVAPKATYVVKNFVYVPPKTSALAVQGSNKPDPGPATSEDAKFTIEDESGNSKGAFDLEPIRGKGYPELKVILTARKIGDTAPPAPVLPTCRAVNKCEYGLSKNYAVSLSDDKLLQMVPRGDGIAIVPKVMNVEIPQAVDIVYSVDNRPWAKKRIVLLSD